MSNPLKTLLLVGAVAAIGAKRHPSAPRFGARNASPTPLARRILATLRNIPDPEQAVRATHFLISVMPNFTAGPGFQFGLPGMCQATEGLVADLQTAIPGATMKDYRDLTITDVENNSLSDDGSINLALQWDMAPHVTWIMTQVAKLVKAAQRGATYNGEEMNQSKALSMLRQWQGQFGHVRDWLTSPNPERWTNGVQLNQLSWADANTASDLFHDALRSAADADKIREARRRGIYFDCLDGRAREESKVVYTFPSGWRVHQLTTAKALTEEGNTTPENGGGCLRHCIGNPGGSYISSVRGGQGEAYSFRSPDGHPIATLYFNGTGNKRRMDQVKSYRNRIPGTKPSGGAAEGFYRRIPTNEDGVPTSSKPIMANYFASVDEMLDAEVDMIQEFLNHLNADWSADNAGLRERNERMNRKVGRGSSARRR